ncbi:MAG: 4a-hydroxytetrahydrobiopterin dehydratase [Acidobacteriota bacterium]
MPGSTSALASEKCIPCRGGVPPLKGDALEPLIAQLGGEWAVVDQHHLQKSYRFPDFAQALAFTVRVGAIAEAEGHHPDLLLRWGEVRVEIWTHAVDGLTRSDFVLAAKIEAL